MNGAPRVVSREELPEARPWHLPVVGPRLPQSADSGRSTVAELEAISEQARREGHEQGLQEGRQAASEELNRQCQLLQRLCDTLAHPLQQLDGNVERQLADLATLIARRVLRAELRLQPEHLLGIVHAAIGALPANTINIQITVHPDAAKLLRLGVTDASERGWRIIEDDTLEPGDCCIAGTESRIDARIETRLAALIDAALDEDATPATSGARA